MNQKIFLIIVLTIILIVLGVVVFSTKNNDIPNISETEWQLVNTDAFRLLLPPDWRFIERQGIDSYIGEFVGDEMKLGFDYGWYSGSLVEENDPNYLITYETIDGYKARIITPKLTGEGITGVYFDDLGGGEQKNKLTIHGQDLSESQKEIALSIFRTLQFNVEPHQ